ncbi:hypothetical protein [Deinococcus hopiensis]|uniref:Uncharacterized protein n=1 Tax=Deinococcus hopiensis KR-140 TaxID=695939 RepID=A0A1W1URE3_9DEIO|nr:hypothetical protein [Deinococcus hopiensis]SMB83381.1 hypothetical protein SAMN00790413_04398 [Deinococcus hopiensis KR-140]
MERVAHMPDHPNGNLEIFEDEYGEYHVFAVGKDVTDVAGSIGVAPKAMLLMAAEFWDKGLF